LGKGPYPNLFSPESFALWVGNDVTALRRAHAVEKGESIDPGLDAAAKNIDENFLVFECSFSSAFGDMSIAYDVVGLRGMSVYLATADGKRIDPVEVVLASSAREEPREALRNFTRTSMVFFPKRDIARNVPVLDGKEGFVRLVVENYNTVFYFEWAPAKAKAAPWVPNKDEYLKAVKTGFNEFFGCVKNIVHATQ
jgi:hypothetical protein